MTKAFEQLRTLLQRQGTLTDEDFATIESQYGSVTDAERLWLSIEAHDRRQREGDAITVEQYVQATRLLESSPPGSPDYERARRIMDAFENAA